MNKDLVNSDTELVTFVLEKVKREEVEEDLKKVGFDVLVFIASTEEDLGRITCGNAIMSGTVPLVPYTEV